MAVFPDLLGGLAWGTAVVGGRRSGIQTCVDNNGCLQVSNARQQLFLTFRPVARVHWPVETQAATKELPDISATLFSNTRLTSHGVYSYPQVSLGKPHSDCHRALCPALTIALVSALFTPSSSQASGRCGLPAKCCCSVLPKHFKTGRVGSEQECVSHPKGHDSEKRVCVPQLSALEDDIKQAMQNTRPWGLNQANWEPEIAAYQ